MTRHTRAYLGLVAVMFGLLMAGTINAALSERAASFIEIGVLK